MNLGYSLDIHNLLSKVSFSTTGIPGEIHYVDPFSGTPMSFCGPNTSLFGEDGRPARLNSDGTPKLFSAPKNKIDDLCLKHDILYKDAEFSKTDPSQVLSKKHQADEELLKGLERLELNSFPDKFQRWIVDKIIRMKLRFGLALPEKEMKKQEAKELHTRILHKFPRRQVVISNLDEIWS